MYASRCVLTGSMFRFLYSRLSFYQKKCIHECECFVCQPILLIYFFILYPMLMYIFVCSYKSAKIKPNIFVLLRYT